MGADVCSSLRAAHRVCEYRKPAVGASDCPAQWKWQYERQWAPVVIGSPLNHSIESVSVSVCHWWYRRFLRSRCRAACAESDLYFPSTLPIPAVEMDGNVGAGFALGLIVVTGLLFGVAPAWLGSKSDLNDA